MIWIGLVVGLIIGAAIDGFEGAFIGGFLGWLAGVVIKSRNEAKKGPAGKQESADAFQQLQDFYKTNEPDYWRELNKGANTGADKGGKK